MDAHQRWLVANWKMNGTRRGAAAFAFQLNRALISAPSWLSVVFCPPAILLGDARGALPQNARLALGAQDCHAAANGAFTGSTSAPMLAEAGCGYVILGHSERRGQCHERCEDVLAKAKSAIAAAITPILCVGETQEEYARGATAQVLATQCAHFATLPVGSYLIAYEPVWAIGSGKTPTTQEIAAAHRSIKSTLGSAVHVLYGGSVKSANIREILACDEVSGALIGGASLDVESMRAMIAETVKG